LNNIETQFQERTAEPQVAPLRFAPVGMTILLWTQELRREILDPALEIVIPRACDFIRFREKPMLKTKNLGASKSAKNQ
jgi:hypothetical protein